MATSPYIHHYRDIGEQGLIQSITAETIYLGGRDVIYLPREDYNREDAIFGQATQLVFRQAVNVAMMLESTEGFEGEGEFYSKFGLDIKDRVTLSLSRKTWEELNFESAAPTQITNREDADGFDRIILELSVRYTTSVENLLAENNDRIVPEDTDPEDVAPDRFLLDVEIVESTSVNDRIVMEDDSGDTFYTEDTTQYGSRHRRPIEGDLIYFPYNKKCFQITFVEHESPFYPGGTLPQFVLTCDLLEYSNEIFLTGIPEIDSIEDNLSQMAVEATCTTIEGGAVGQFQRGEIIRKTTILGTNDSNASTASARVLSHDPNTGKLVVAPMTPALKTGDAVFGLTSKAYASLTYIIADGIGTEPSIQLEELQQAADEQAMNVELEQVAGDFIDFSEVDPFSEGNF